MGCSAVFLFVQAPFCCRFCYGPAAPTPPAMPARAADFGVESGFSTFQRFSTTAAFHTRHCRLGAFLGGKSTRCGPTGALVSQLSTFSTEFSTSFCSKVWKSPPKPQKFALLPQKTAPCRRNTPHFSTRSGSFPPFPQPAKSQICASATGRPQYLEEFSTFSTRFSTIWPAAVESRGSKSLPPNFLRPDAAQTAPDVLQ